MSKPIKYTELVNVRNAVWLVVFEATEYEGDLTIEIHSINAIEDTEGVFQYGFILDIDLACKVAVKERQTANKRMMESETYDLS